MTYSYSYSLERPLTEAKIQVKIDELKSYIAVTFGKEVVHVRTEVCDYPGDEKITCRTILETVNE